MSYERKVFIIPLKIRPIGILTFNYLVSDVGSAVGGLQRVGVYDAHVTEDNPSGGLFGAGQRKATVLEIETILGILVQEEREHLHQQKISFAGTKEDKRNRKIFKIESPVVRGEVPIISTKEMLRKKIK